MGIEALIEGGHEGNARVLDGLDANAHLFRRKVYGLLAKDRPTAASGQVDHVVVGVRRCGDDDGVDISRGNDGRRITHLHREALAASLRRFRRNVCYRDKAGIRYALNGARMDLANPSAAKYSKSDH